MYQLRRFLRNYLKRRHPNFKGVQFSKNKANLALFYAFAGWNGLGLLAYFLITDKYPMTEEEKTAPALYYARLIQAENFQVYDVSGLTVKDSYAISGKIPLTEEDADVQDGETFKIIKSESLQLNNINNKIPL